MSACDQAASDKGLDLQAVVAELSALQRPSELPDLGTPTELIEHIVARYHEVHRAQLPELIRMARRVEAVHRDNPNTPHGLADALETMEQELLMHMHKEEAVLFPMLRAGGNSFVSQPIAMMRHEHNDHGEALEHLASLTNDITPPMGACNTWRALYTGLAQLREDLINHIHLEEQHPFRNSSRPRNRKAAAAVAAAAHEAPGHPHARGPDRPGARVRRRACRRPAGPAVRPRHWRALDTHLERMVEFWSTVALGTRSFKGDVFGKHMAVDGVAPRHFAVWLRLWGQHRARVRARGGTRAADRGPRHCAQPVSRLFRLTACWLAGAQRRQQPA
jgi:regulator of cell morphogenesis and NO signaling